jgi:hypothetical protein
MKRTLWIAVAVGLLTAGCSHPSHEELHKAWMFEREVTSGYEKSIDAGQWLLEKADRDVANAKTSEAAVVAEGERKQILTAIQIRKAELARQKAREEQAKKRLDRYRGN